MLAKRGTTRHASTSPQPTGLTRFAPDRRASWFELFFDLVFVVFVAQLNGSYVKHDVAAGAEPFAFGFIARWWRRLGYGAESALQARVASKASWPVFGPGIRVQILAHKVACGRPEGARVITNQ